MGKKQTDKPDLLLSQRERRGMRGKIALDLEPYDNNDNHDNL